MPEYDNLTDFCSDEQLAWLAAHSCACCGEVFEDTLMLVPIDDSLFCRVCVAELDME